MLNSVLEAAITDSFTSAGSHRLPAPTADLLKVLHIIARNASGWRILWEAHLGCWRRVVRPAGPNPQNEEGGVAGYTCSQASLLTPRPFCSSSDICIYIYTYIHTHTLAYMHTCMCIKVHIHTCIYIYIIAYRDVSSKKLVPGARVRLRCRCSS